MPGEVVKTRSITHHATLELTDEEISAYVIAGVKRDHKDLKDHEMTVVFHAHTSETCPPITATVSGERVG